VRLDWGHSSSIKFITLVVCCYILLEVTRSEDDGTCVKDLSHKTTPCKGIMSQKPYLAKWSQKFLRDKVILMPYLTKWPYLSTLLYDLVQFELMKKSFKFWLPSLPMHLLKDNNSTFDIFIAGCYGVLEARWMQIALDQNDCTGFIAVKELWHLVRLHPQRSIPISNQPVMVSFGRYACLPDSDQATKRSWLGNSSKPCWLCC